LKDYVRIPFPAVEKRGNLWRGEVLVVDGYGNLITNLRSDEIAPLASRSKLWFDLPPHPSVRGLASSYAAVEEGRLLAIEGSSGFVEIAVRNGSAAAATGLKAGDAIVANFRT
jgi:S-adenosylmethionine hydrolase